MHKATPLLTALLLLIAPGIGAEAPDHVDDDGDFASGPVGILGVSTDSGDRTFRFDLHIDAFDFSDASVRYAWLFEVQGTAYLWTCDAFRTYNGPIIDCRIVDVGQDTLNQIQIPDAPLPGWSEDLLDLFSGLDPRKDSLVAATHHMDHKTTTVGFTLPYSTLGLERGDAITLVGGEAHFSQPSKTWIGAPADAMILGEQVTLR